MEDQKTSNEQLPTQTEEKTDPQSQNGKSKKRSKAARVFGRYLDDIAELSIIEDSGSIKTIKGFAIVDDVHYSISIRKHEADPDTKDGPKYTYTGTISMRSPIRRKVLVSDVRKRKLQNTEKKDIKAKDCYASLPYYSNEETADGIANGIRSIITKLYEENKAQYEEEYGRYLPADHLTPKHVIRKYLDSFLSARSTNLELNNKVRRRIESTFDILPSTKISSISRRTVQNLIKNKNVSEAATSDCFAFFDYLISAKIIPGPNIFPPAAKREPTDEQKDQKAFFSHELSDVVFTRFFERLNSKISTAYCGVALYASGFTYENEIEELRWKDLKFVKGYTDFVVVPVHKDHLVISKHDFSRPAIPDTALYLRRVYHHLCKCYGRDEVNTWRIIAEKEKDKKDKSKDKYIDKPIEKKALGKIANNLLLLAGYDFGQQNCNSSTDTHANTALKVLTDNYYRMLVTRAGLANDADTRSFLQGTVLRSSTYTNYESHTSPEAQYRLYKILLPVSSEKKINPPSIKDKSTFAATPKTNHEVAQIIGKIRLKPGEGITIEVPSGVTGTIEANDFDGAKPFVNINKDDCAT